LKWHDFTGCGKTRSGDALYQGMTSVVPQIAENKLGL